YSDDAFPHEILKCIDAKATLDTPIVDHSKGITRGRLKFGGEDYHIKSAQDMLEKFEPQDIANTKKIADMCEVTFERKNHMPKFDPKLNPEQAYEKLVQECRKGWKFRKLNEKSNKDEYTNRIKEELADIKEAGLADYFLIV